MCNNILLNLTSKSDISYFNAICGVYNISQGEQSSNSDVKVASIFQNLPLVVRV